MDDLRCFVAVVEQGNFSSAARQLGMTPSAVSKVVSRLEERLGVRLLNRTTRAVSLTEEGRMFHERSRGILEDLDDMERTVRDMQSRPAGTLRITTTPAFGISVLLDVIHEYNREYPDVRFDVNLAEETVDIVAKGIDLALREGLVQDSRLVARKLTDTRFLACAPPGWFADGGQPETLEEFFRLDSVSYITPRVEEIARRMFGERIDFSTINLRLQINTFHGMREAVKKGLGVSLLPCYFVEEDVLAGRLQALPHLQVPSVPISAVYPGARLLSPKVRTFIDFLVEHFADNPPVAERLRLANG